jgi:predicted NBD/HSP70 family sugar kinase
MTEANTPAQPAPGTVVVIGGGIMKRGDILLKHTRKAFEERIGGYL